jgi:hypothetical protein
MANDIRIAILRLIRMCRLLAGTDVSEELPVTSTLRRKAAYSSEEIVLSYHARTRDDLDHNKKFKTIFLLQKGASCALYLIISNSSIC